MIFKSVGGGYLQNLQNPLALLLTIALVSCHPAPAIAGGMSANASIQTPATITKANICHARYGLNDGLVTGVTATRQREFPRVPAIPARVVTESGEVHRIGRYVLMTFAMEEAA